MKTINRVKKEKGAHPLIKIIGPAAKGIQLGAFAEQLVQGGRVTDQFEGLIAQGRILRGDEVEELAAHVISRPAFPPGR